MRSILRIFIAIIVIFSLAGCNYSCIAKTKPAQEQGEVAQVTQEEKETENSFVIVVEHYPNNDVRAFHLHREVTKEYVWFHYKEEIDKEILPAWQEIIPLARMIFKVEGIEEVRFKKYQISIMKGSAFSWAEIQPGIIRTIAEYYEVPESNLLIKTKEFGK